MLRTSKYIINFLLILVLSIDLVHAQDTIDFPLKIRVGVEVSGPALYYSNKNILQTEAYIGADLNERSSVILGGGYLKYNYSQSNYDFINKGIFVRTGIEFNLLKPEKSQGKYWAGLGFHYGLSHFTSNVPFFRQDTYWGSVSSSIEKRTNWGHFVEATPGVRAELFKNITVGWTISLRFLVYTNTGNDLKPLFFPGFGNGAKTFSSGISYFLVYNIPFKRIKVVPKVEEPDEPDETTPPGTTKPATGVRQ
jgi:hypothetical protein